MTTAKLVIDRVYQYIDTPLLVLLKVWSYILRHEMGHVILAPAQSQLPHYILYQPVKVFSSETASHIEEQRGKEHLDSISTYLEVSADLVSKVDMEKIYHWIKKIDHDNLLMPTKFIRKSPSYFVNKSLKEMSN